MLGSLSIYEAMGVCGVPSRVVQAAVVPLSAFLAAVYPRYFSAGSRGGLAGSRGITKKTVPICGLYGIALFSILWFLAPLLASFIGKRFQDTALAIKVLAVVVVTQSLQYPFLGSLSGGGFQYIRAELEWIALGVDFLLNLFLIPAYGWMGAAVATIAIQVILILLAATAPWYLNWMVTHFSLPCLNNLMRENTPTGDDCFQYYWSREGDIPR